MKQSYMDEGKATGRCQFCASPAVPGRTLCRKHLDYNKTKSKELSAKAAERGDCVMCRSQPATTGYRTCEPCRSRVRVRVLRLRAAGICVECAARPLVEGKTRCIECGVRARQRVAFGAKSAHSLNGMRTATLERDAHQCRLCHDTKRLLIHHIDGNGVSSPGDTNNQPANLITLCKSCHGWLEGLLRTGTDIPLLITLIQRRPLER